MSEHTSEPWTFRWPSTNLKWTQNIVIINQTGTRIANVHSRALPIRKRSTHTEATANARRIVACVNACKGISTDALENMNISEMLEG